MAKLIAYNFITLDGYYKGIKEDISWHMHGKEESEYSEEMLALDNVLVFGRKTFEFMASFWPTPFAAEMYPKVAEGMNKAEKILITRNPQEEVGWKNTTTVTGDVVTQIRKLKAASAKDFTILGSGSIINLFTEYNLIDEYQIMIDPVAIGSGTSIFSGIKSPLPLKLKRVRTFKSGVVLLCYHGSN